MSSTVTKPKIVQDVAVYHIGSSITADYVRVFLDNLERHRPILRGLGVRGVLFSLSSIETFDKDAFLNVVQRLDLLQKELKVPTGITGYTEKQFAILKMLLQDTAVALYKNSQIAALAIGTSRIRKSSPILVYTDDNDEKNMITSELISNGYFVILANNFNDFKKKFEKKNLYGLIVAQSRFGGMRDDVMVLYTDRVYYYTIRGIIDETIFARFDFEGHTERLKKGFKAFVIDVSKLNTMDIKGAHFFLRLADEAAKYGVMMALVGMDVDKLYSNARNVMERCHIWVYDDMDEVFIDEEFLAQRENSRSRNENNYKPSKEMVMRHPYFLSVIIETIKTYGKWQLEYEKAAIGTMGSMFQKDVSIENVISFDGDVDGSFTFFFPRETAKALARSMTGIDFDDDLTQLLDVMGEFVNSATGKIKSSIVKKKVYLSFSLPSSKLMSDNRLTRYKDVNGVILQIRMDGMPLYVFICGGKLR